jgi:aerobic carbon-monoxide dehydrogenase medium subunit
VRNVGTIGGNLCFADPHSESGDLPRRGGWIGYGPARGGPARQFPVEQFTRGPYQNALAQGELPVSVHVPEPTPGSALVYRKVSFRERPAITLAANLTVRDGTVSESVERRSIWA